MIVDLCALICFPDGDCVLTTALKEKLSILTYAVLWSLSKLLPLALLLIVNAIGSCLCLQRISVPKLMQNILPIVGAKGSFKSYLCMGRSELPT